jgi:hypothetical protein
MHRAGADPEHMQAEDFLCDFCGSHWAPDRPMIEGHRGSLICGSCLSAAWLSVLGPNSAREPLAAAQGASLGDGSGAGARDGLACVMCLEVRREAHWGNPLRAESRICRRCIDLSARRLARDPDAGWKPPG